MGNLTTWCSICCTENVSYELFVRGLGDVFEMGVEPHRFSYLGSPTTPEALLPYLPYP